MIMNFVFGAFGDVLAVKRRRVLASQADVSCS